jgi:hypothetical protein
MNMKRKYFFIFGFITFFNIIFLAGCIQPDFSVVPAELDKPFQLKINQTGFIKGENIKIIFLNVTEDSRCPSDVECIWPGQVTILIDIFKSFQSIGEFNLTIPGESDEIAIIEFDGYSLKMIKVEPYPISTQEIKLSDYIITFIVNKL